MADRLLVSTNMPRPYRYVTYADYEPNRGHPLVLKWLQEWEPLLDPCLLLAGAPGMAKTMLSCAVLNEYQGRVSCPQLTGEALVTYRQSRFPVYFVQLAEWISLTQRSFTLHSQVMSGYTDPAEYLTLDSLLQDIQYKVRMLVVDDVGKEHHTSSNFSQDAFDLLVRTRFNNGLITIFTSNLQLRDWSLQYSESMRSFIKRTAQQILFFDD